MSEPASSDRNEQGKPVAVRCAQCQQPMTFDEFFSDDHAACRAKPRMTVAEAEAAFND